MADSKHKPPTRAEAADAIRGICGTYTKETLGMLESAGVVFAPEPVAPKRGDLLTENTELVDGLVVRKGNIVLVLTTGDWLEPGFQKEWSSLPVGYQIIDVPGEVDTPEPAPTDTREEVSEAIARLLEQFGEDVLGDPIKPDIAAWIAREYGKRNLSPIAQLRDKLAGEGGRS